ncbi:MAG TPA: hypothetical protein VGX92_19470, partial [Pyrinomonadaceae bacterium]|nr:hypothetical protein [Pyrinomonadaceae bacterium]
APLRGPKPYARTFFFKRVLKKHRGFVPSLDNQTGTRPRCAARALCGILSEVTDRAQRVAEVVAHGFP